MVTIVEAVCVQKHLDDARACTLCILSAVDVAAATHVHARVVYIYRLHWMLLLRRTCMQWMMLLRRTYIMLVQSTTKEVMR